jgi:hypothetical protein
MLGIRECNSIDEELANGFTIISTCCMQCLESKPEASAGKYDKAFRLLQQSQMTMAESNWLDRFIERYPDDFVSLLEQSKGLTGVPSHLVVVEEKINREFDDEELLELNASGRAGRASRRK